MRSRKDVLHSRKSGLSTQPHIFPIFPLYMWSVVVTQLPAGYSSWRWWKAETWFIRISQFKPSSFFTFLRRVQLDPLDLERRATYISTLYRVIWTELWTELPHRYLRQKRHQEKFTHECLLENKKWGQLRKYFPAKNTPKNARTPGSKKHNKICSSEHLTTVSNVWGSRQQFWHPECYDGPMFFAFISCQKFSVIIKKKAKVFVNFVAHMFFCVCWCCFLIAVCFRDGCFLAAAVSTSTARKSSKNLTN